MTKIWRVMVLGLKPATILGGAFGHRAGRDLAVIGLFTVGVWAVAVRFDFLERYLNLTERLERWQIDELMFVLTALSLGLFWYAMRRWREAQQSSLMHQRAEWRIGELLTHNRELAQQLIAVQDNERRALARELHDEMGQSCSAIRAEAALVDRTAASDPAAARAAARRIEATGEALHRCVRQMLRRLRPANLDALGLLGAIQALCESWETSSGVACVFHHDGSAEDWGRLGDEVNVTVYRVVQEALSNVMRHADASQVRIGLRREAAGEAAPRLLLNVTDNGSGMDAQASHGGLGLLGARERAALMGGELHVASTPGQGLGLHMWLPLPQQAEGRP